MGSFEDYIPASDKQLFVCGMKGSGKTQFVKHLLTILAKKHVVIFIDSKPDYKENELVPFDEKRPELPHALTPSLWLLEKRSLSKKGAKGLYVYRNKGGKLVYNDVFVDKLIDWSMKDDDREVTMYFDESSDFSRGQFTTPMMDKLLRQSRSRNVRLILGTQRPKGIPAMYVNQADMHAVFYMQSKADRKHLAENAHVAMEQPPSGPYSFWWYVTPKNGVAQIKHVQQT